MTLSITHTPVYCLDLDKSLAFYTEQLGFQVREDVPMGPQMRWLTVAAPGAGPEPDTVCLHPDPYAGPGPAPQFDCTCIWTPAPGASPQATAATIAAVLTALRPGRT